MTVAVAKFQDMFKSFFSDIANTITAKTIEALKTEIQKKDVIIGTQEREIHDPKDKVDDMEQWTRRESIHAGTPNSPFSAKIRPFAAQTTRFWQKTTPILGKIRPFALRSSRYPHAIFSIEINVAKEQ